MAAASHQSPGYPLNASTDMQRSIKAWEPALTGLLAVVVAGALAYVSLGLKPPVLGLSLPSSWNWIWNGLASTVPLLLFGLVAWLSWMRVADQRVLQGQQQHLGRLAVVAQKTDNVVILTQSDGTIAWVNEAFSRITGYKLAEVMGKWPAAVLLGPQQNAQAIERIREGISHRRHFSLELACVHKSGARFWLNLSFAPLTDRDGRASGYVIVGADLTARKQVEEELRRVNRQYELLLHAAGEGICALDPQGRIAFVNPAASRITGWAPAELVGQPLSTLISQLRRTATSGSSDDVLRLAAAQDPSITTGHTTLFRRKDGTCFPVDCTSTPVRDGSNVLGAVVVFRDITDRRQTEALRVRQTRQYALRADIALALTAGDTLEQFLHRTAQAIVKHLDGTLAVIWVHDPDEKVLKLQAKAGADLAPDAPLHRLEVGDLAVGRLAAQRIPYITDDLLQDAAPLERDWIKRDKLTAFAGYPMIIEGRLVGVLGLYGRKPLPEDTLEALGAIAETVGQGIMRKQAEAKLAQQAALLDKAQDAILVVDLEHRIQYWNKSAERLYGWTPSEAYGKRADTLLFRDAAYFERARQEVLLKGEWRGEQCQVNRGDETVIVESQWTLVQDEAGKPKSILIVNTDIREKKKMEAQFLRTQRIDSLGTLAGGIAHDLNNVLAPILMAAQMLKTKFTDPQSQRLLTVVESSAKRGADMVKQVLTFARGVEGERMLLQPRHLIKEMVKILGETFPKNIQVKQQLQPDLMPVLGDPTQLHQVLLNLCVNARDAMPQGGVLTLSAENCVLEQVPATLPALGFSPKPGPYVLLKVADTGCGIPPENLDKIFDPFFTTKEVGKGTGLGLATVLGIVKSHGGFVQVQSEVNKGTVFSIYLPAADKAQAASSQPESGALPKGRGELILVVDDETAVLSMMKEMLETFGYRTLTASDGTEAVAAFTAHRGEIKAVIVDMLMPHMDGPATIRVLRKLEPQVRLIAASGLMDAQRAKDATGLDDLYFLMKPFTAESLLTTVHQVLAE